MSMNIDSNEFPVSGNVGDKIIINGIETVIKISFQLITGDEEYYNVKTKKGIVFKIDKPNIFDVLVYKKEDNSLVALEWEASRHNKKFIINIFGDGYINIVNYLKKEYTNLTNKKLNIKFINNDYYDFRMSNIENIPILGDNATKYKKVDIKPEFFGDNDIIESKIIAENNGHQNENGPCPDKYRNKYKLVEVNKEDGTKYKYYEIGVGKNDKNNNEFTFIIDEQDKSILDNLYFAKNKVYCKIEDIPEEDKAKVYTINNPTWYILDSQYIVSSIDIIGYEVYLVYIYRLLMGCQKDDGTTVDHINGNKFDNRRSNLRITTMSMQNQNRDNVKRGTTLNDILNPEKKPDIPKLSIDNLKFIMFREDASEYFDIEFKTVRTGLDSDIKKHSTKAAIFRDDKIKARRVKLCHAICIRYLMAVEYPNIIKEKIDNKNFASIDDFKTNANALITEVMGTPYTVDTFLDYMNTLRISKYTDPRKSKTPSADTLITDINFDGIHYSSERDKYNASFNINKKGSPKKKMTLDGSGSKKLSTEDKICFALIQRYNLLITLENDINTQLHGDTQLPITNPINTNTSTLKSLTDFEFASESKTKFANFDELRTYTEECINKFLKPELPYTLETFATYINKKVNTDKTNLKIATLQYNYPILVS